ncbi:carbohydrate ABC transporter permease [Alteribacillus sp. HJP-4]|uniref:carbohydrate ABC transporter permease n=1 Tax=Alteribacillus sp. HJP-4 TaxID=2775394 RepID=UPI0035CD0210
MKYYNKNLFIMLAPALLILFGLVAYALIQAVLQSLKPPDGIGWTVEAYKDIFKNKQFWRSSGFSAYIAGVSVLISVPLGLLFTKLLYGQLLNNNSRVMAWIPMIFPHFVAAYLVLLIFSQSGMISSVAAFFGWVKDPSGFPILTNDRHGIGILISYIWKEIPFVILMLLPVYFEMDDKLKDVSAALGGSRLHQFKDVEWPQLKPTVVETSIIIFAFVLGAFEVPYLIGASSPQMGAVTAYEWFFSGNWEERPQAMAVMVLYTTGILALAALCLLKIRKWRRRLWLGGES